MIKARKLLALLLAIVAISCSYRTDKSVTGSDYREKINEFRSAKNKKFKNPEESPFEKADRKQFENLNYFDIKKEYVVRAQFVKIEDGEPFIMPTTGDKQPRYVRYGRLNFTLKDQELQLTVYRNLAHRNSEKFDDYLFVPFADKTNGETTYGGGRYIDLYMPLYNGQIITLDFNKAYNPWCVYNYDEYDCPIPPEENRLKVAIQAGEKDFTPPTKR